MMMDPSTPGEPEESTESTEITQEVVLVVRAPLDTPPGQIEVHLDLGPGPYTRAGADPAFYAATLRRLAMHLLKYAADYEQTAGAGLQPPLTDQQRAGLEGVRRLLHDEEKGRRRP